MVVNRQLARLDVDKESSFIQQLVDSKVLPKSVSSSAAAFAILQYGSELGFLPMQSFSHIVMVDGKPTLSAMAYAALLMRAGIRMKTIYDGAFVYGDEISHNRKKKVGGKEGEELKPSDRITTIEFTRIYPDGERIVESVTYTWKDAAAQELVEKANWKKMPREMLYARCMAKGSRRVAPDIVLGLYLSDEIADAANIDETKIQRSEEGNIISIDP